MDDLILFSAAVTLGVISVLIKIVWDKRGTREQQIQRELKSLK